MRETPYHRATQESSGFITETMPSKMPVVHLRTRPELDGFCGAGYSVGRGYSVERTRGDAAARTWIFPRVAATPRPRRGYSVERTRGDAAARTWIFPRVAATPRPGRGYSVETSRGDGATRIFHGDASRRRRGWDMDIPWRRVAATARRGYSTETRRGDATAGA